MPNVDHVGPLDEFRIDVEAGDEKHHATGN
jgi:hypothetical protein